MLSLKAPWMRENDKIYSKRKLKQLEIFLKSKIVSKVKFFKKKK